MLLYQYLSSKVESYFTTKELSLKREVILKDNSQVFSIIYIFLNQEWLAGAFLRERWFG